jgi:cyanophycinase
VVDAGNLQFSSMDQVAEDQPVCLLGMTIHILTAGATFNLATRTASAGSLVTPKKTH